MTVARTLADAPVGAVVTLGAVVLAPRWARRMAELGIRPGARVRLVTRTSGGAAVLAIADDRIAIDRDTLRQLTLDEVDRNIVVGAGPGSGRPRTEPASGENR